MHRVVSRYLKTEVKCCMLFLFLFLILGGNLSQTVSDLNSGKIALLSYFNSKFCPGKKGQSPSENDRVHISFQVSVFILCGKILRSKIAGLYSGSIFNFLRKLHTVFYSGYINLPPHQQGIRVPFYSHSPQHLLSHVFLMTAILACMRHLFVVVNCISQKVKDVEHLFTCPLATGCSFWRNICLGLLPVF